MGEAKQEETKAEAKPEEKDEKVAEKQEEKKEEKAEEKNEEVAAPVPPPGPPPPTILSVDLHCVGCSKKIKRSIFKCRGVEEVEMDMVQNQVTVKGIVDPQALCSSIKKKTMRTAKVLSPLPPADAEATQPEAAPPQVSGVATVELLVNMHCEACAQQLRRKILKMRGVQAVETEFAAGKATVTGTMNPDRLVEYIHRRTGKLAKVIPPPPPPLKEEEEKKEEAEKKPEETASEEKKEEQKKEKEEEKKEEKAPAEENTSAEGGKDDKKDGEEPKKESETPPITEEDMVKKLAYLYGGGTINYGNYGNYGYSMIGEEEMARRMVHWMPLYVVEPPPPPPPPQMFSDENPNACSIS